MRKVKKMRKAFTLILLAIAIMVVAVSCDDHVHTYSDNWSSDETYHWHAATCEHTDAVKDKAEHTWDDGVITTPATADADVVRTYTCTVCKKTKTESIEKHEHKYGEWKIDEENNKHYHICSVCNYKVEEDHDYEWKQTEDKSKHYQECKDCGLKTNEAAHSYSTDYKKDEADHWHECECGAKSEVTAHTFGEWTVVDGTENEKHTCSACSYEATRAISKWDSTIDTSWYERSKASKEYTLTTPSELAGLAKLVNDATDAEDKNGIKSCFSGWTIKLGGNINLDGKTWTPIGLYDKADGDGGDVSQRTLFSGTFDGQGYTIVGLYFNNNKCETVALFGYVDGTVKNFTVKGEITAKSAAGVVGGLEKGGTVENVTSYVNVVSDFTDTKAKFGGIVLTLKNKLTSDGVYTIKGCKNYGEVASSSNNSGSIGGILGWTSDESEKLTIEDCENHGEIKATGTLAAGGIVGACRTITIKDCTNEGNVSSANSAAGGIVGYNDTTTATLTNCRNTGTVSGKADETGGIAGRIPAH